MCRLFQSTEDMCASCTTAVTALYILVGRAKGPMVGKVSALGLQEVSARRKSWMWKARALRGWRYGMWRQSLAAALP